VYAVSKGIAQAVRPYRQQTPGHFFVHGIAMTEQPNPGTPVIGDSITYRLRTAERPVNPLMLWHGVVENIYVSPDFYRVRITGTGYENTLELVLPYQIVSVDEPEDSQNRQGKDG